MLVQLLIPGAAQVPFLAGRLVHEAASVVLVHHLFVVFQVVLTEVSFVLTFAGLLGTKYEGIVALSDIRVLVRHFR